MANVYLSDKHFERIGRALRRRLNSTETFTPGEMADAIRKLTTVDDGGGNALEDGMLQGTVVKINSDNIGLVAHGCCDQANLESVTLPNCTQLTRGAFARDPKLRVVGLDSLISIPESAFAECTSLKYLVFPNVETISYNDAFRGCTALKRIIVPKFMKFIDTEQGVPYSYDTPNFEAFVINRTIAKRGNMPSSFGSLSFSDSGKYYIYVPAEDLETYQRVFPDRSFRAIEDYPDIAGEVEA